MPLPAYRGAMILRRVSALFALLLILLPAPAMAWWDYGHESVGEIALANVSPRARAAIRRLLAKQALLETPACPAGTIGEASVWADCVKQKSLRDRFSYQETWHYQDSDVCKPYDIKPACKDGNCVSAQIERQMRLLKDPSVPEREKVKALALLVHFVGDIHQPLHTAEYHDDGGGNGTRTDYGIVRNDRMNLHKIWDGYLPERALSTRPGVVHAYPAEERARLSAGTLQDWAKESWEVARDRVYPAALGADYCAAPKGQRGAMNQEAIDALVPVLRDQVVKGGLRLAKLLDEALG